MAPVVYLGWAFARGLLLDDFSYGWMNPARQGWTKVGIMVALLLGLTLAIALLVVAVARFANRARSAAV
jgi:hypothetical protein